MFIPGRSYRVTITLKRPEMGRGGFQLAARFADDDGRGRQAGHLRPLDDRVQLVHGADSIVYALHTESGSVLADQAETSWIVEWVPPDAAAPVTLHVAANAANDDALRVRRLRVRGGRADAAVSVTGSPRWPLATTRSRMLSCV